MKNFLAKIIRQLPSPQHQNRTYKGTNCSCSQRYFEVMDWSRLHNNILVILCIICKYLNSKLKYATNMATKTQG